MPRGGRALPAACLARLREADAILHAGDFMELSVLESLQALGPPVHAVRGNVDSAELQARLPLVRTAVVRRRPHRRWSTTRGPPAGRLERMRRRFPGVAAVVFGHSHIPLLETRRGFTIFNPGSPDRAPPGAAPHDGDRRGRRRRASRFELDRASTSLRGVDLSLFFAGTAGSVPTARRGLPALLLRAGGERILFDCGEGTQQQLLRSIGLPELDAIFITHFHLDHWLGLVGMLKTFDLRARERPLDVYGPPGLKALFSTIRPVFGRTAYPLTLVELEPHEEVRFDGYVIGAFPVKHRVEAYGYAFVEDERPGRFDVEAARRLGVTEGPGLRPPAARRDGQRRRRRRRSWARRARAAGS